MDYSNLPSYMQGSVKDYIELGHPLGDFLTAVFSNNLVQALAKADSTNIHYMRDYAQMLYLAPMACWGSEEKVKAWQQSGGIQGIPNQEKPE